MSFLGSYGFADQLTMVALDGLGLVTHKVAPLVSAYQSLFIIGSSSSQTPTITSTTYGLVGMGGNDVLNGAAGSDFLVGDFFDPAAFDYWFDGVGSAPVYNKSSFGNDRLNGGDGDDSLIDDLGNDSLYGGNGDDIFAAWVDVVGANIYSGGEGYDTLYFEDVYNLGHDTVKSSRIILDDAASIEKVEFVGVGLSGTEGNDIFDFSGVDSFGAFDDFGSPNQLFEVDMGNGNDKFVFGEGYFSVLAVNGGAGNDTITGGSGSETIDGGSGVDSMKGGQGWDVYLVDNAADVVVEGQQEGDVDEVRVTVSNYKIPENVEFLYYLGTASFSGTGTNGHDRMYGGGKNDTLIGNGGSDILDGGRGADSMEGGGGNDLYQVHDKNDVTIELANKGIDQVQVVGVTKWTLGDNIENMLYLDSADFSGAGNNLNNTMSGQSGNESFLGLDGADTLYGRDGNDQLEGGAGQDYLYGEKGSDSLHGGLGADELIGGANADVFVFDTALSGANADSLSDYKVADDTMWLERSGDGLFNTLGLGALSASKFKVFGAGSLDSSDRILYDMAKGKIYYDQDGSGAAEKVLFATVTAGTVLTEADFFVI